MKLGKDLIDKMEQSNVAYKLSYGSCEKTYVGQTKKLLNIRCNEPKDNIFLNEKYYKVTSKHRTSN